MTKNNKANRTALAGAMTMMLIIGLLALTPTASAESGDVTGYSDCEKDNGPNEYEESCDKVVAGTNGVCRTQTYEYGTYDENGEKVPKVQQSSTTCVGGTSGGTVQVK